MSCNCSSPVTKNVSHSHKLEVRSLMPRHLLQKRTAKRFYLLNLNHQQHSTTGLRAVTEQLTLNTQFKLES